MGPLFCFGAVGPKSGAMKDSEVKICGLKEPRHVAAALRHEADYIGFIIFPNSPRHIAPADARPLAMMAAGLAKTVAVVVDPDALLVETILRDLRPDYIQLHGHESPQFCADLRARGVGVIKALGISTAEDVANVSVYDGHVDMTLLDAKPPKGATRSGGLGHTFDWSLLQGLTITTPWMLSGGLTITNVHDAIAATGAKMLDLSSGVETAPGVKDEAMIGAFLDALKTDT